MNPLEAQAISKKNLYKVIDTLPAALKHRENEFFERIKASKLSNLKKLEMLYSFMDLLFKHVHKYTPCKKRCSSCCFYDVTISEIEIEYIERRNRKAKRKKGGLKKGRGHGTPCVFLRNDLCTIYESRPYLCRRHVMLTPNSSWCIADSSLNIEFDLITFTELDKSYEFILSSGGSQELLEIRDVFKGF